MVFLPNQFVASWWCTVNSHCFPVVGMVIKLELVVGFYIHKDSLLRAG